MNDPKRLDTVLDRVEPMVDEQPIGYILVRIGKLTPDDVSRVLEIQAKEGKRFGEIAQRLKLVSSHDVAEALSRQFGSSYLARRAANFGEDLIAAYDPDGPRIEKLRGLRSRVMLECFNDPAHRVLGVVGPTARSGATFVSANLAVVVSQLGLRTLLVDADLRRPAIDRSFRLQEQRGLSDLLVGRAGREAIVGVPGLPYLSILPAGFVPPNPQELLACPGFRHLLEEAVAKFDAVIVDTPPLEGTADASVVLSRCSEALIVFRKDRATFADATALKTTLQQTRTRLLGAVLNDF